MANEAITKTIELIIAPVVMITACAIMLNGLIVRYASLGERLRSAHQEHLNLLETDLNKNHLKAERLLDLEHLLPDLLRHHHLVHNVLVVIYISILVFMLDMLLIALAVSVSASWLSQLVIVVFLTGVGILFWGMVLIAYELSTSHHSLQLEVHRTCQLCNHKRNRITRSKGIS